MKELTELETIDAMLTEGKETMVNVKNNIIRLTILDRMGKRMVLSTPQIQNELGKNQQQLELQKKMLAQTQKSQEYLEKLRVDIVSEGSTLNLKG